MSAYPQSPAPRPKVIAAFAAVYILWGSTYLAIRIGVATLPPFLMAGSRFLIAGGLLYAGLRLRGTAVPSRQEWKNAAIIGTLLLLGGNGLVCWAEQTVPSSLAAIIVAAAPFWFAVFEYLRPGGKRPGTRAILGLVLGFGGVILLVSNTSGSGSVAGTVSIAGVLALILACAFWAGGSIFGKYHTPHASSIWMATAAQMLCGGAANFIVGVFHGDLAAFHGERVSLPSIMAFLYLVIFGSWIGYGAYVWLLKHCSPTKVATYAYVNPVIATFLGWLVLHEPLTPATGLSAGIILTGVVLVQWPASSPAPSPASGNARSDSSIEQEPPHQ
jgi:drug/metabolite transporter (DMT)-like permease